MVLESIAIDSTDFRKNAIERGNIVSLRQKEIVTMRVVDARNIEEVLVQVHDHIGSRQACADKTSAVAGHSNDMFAYGQRETLKVVLLFGFHWITFVCSGRMVVSSSR